MLDGMPGKEIMPYIDSLIRKNGRSKTDSGDRKQAKGGRETRAQIQATQHAQRMDAGDKGTHTGLMTINELIPRIEQLLIHQGEAKELMAAVRTAKECLSNTMCAATALQKKMDEHINETACVNANVAIAPGKRQPHSAGSRM